MAGMDDHRERLHTALAGLLAKRRHIADVKGQLRERVGQQLDTIEGAMATVEKSQEESPNVLVHRRHVGLLDERARLMDAARRMDGEE